MILLLGRGEHCPGERRHRKGDHQALRVVPGRLHQPRHRAAQRPAREVQAQDLRSDRVDLPMRREPQGSTRPRNRGVHRSLPSRDRPAHAHARAWPADRQGLRWLLVLGLTLGLPAVGGPPGPLPPDKAGLRPDTHRGARSIGGDRRRRVADVDPAERLVVARAINVLGASVPLASSNASPVGSRQMTASYPKGSVIALVGEGFGSLLMHCTARYLGLKSRETTIFGTNDGPVATYEQYACNLGQTVLRHPSSSRISWPPPGRRSRSWTPARTSRRSRSGARALRPSGVFQVPTGPPPS